METKDETEPNLLWLIRKAAADEDELNAEDYANRAAEIVREMVAALEKSFALMPSDFANIDDYFAVHDSAHLALIHAKGRHP